MVELIHVDHLQAALHVRPEHDAFGVFGTALQENIGVFHPSSLKMVRRKLQTHRSTFLLS
jgi:hypothetical protein